MDYAKSIINQSDLVENYRDKKSLRNEYFNFISKLFPSADFKEWYAKGFWNDKYNPVSIINDGRIISNVSAMQMNIIVEEKIYNGLQIGAVGTIPEYRNNGLSRILMEYVIEKYSNDSDIFLLFANETVLDFYPKFGFKRFEEKVFISELNIPKAKFAARKLDIQNEADYSLLQGLLNNRTEITKIFGAKDYGSITMWHVLNIHRNNLYYLQDEDSILIMKEKNKQLHIYEIICKEYLDINSVLPKVIKSQEIKYIKFYFPPDQLNYSYNKIIIEDEGLFVLSNLKLSADPFKFPVTAVT